MNDNQNKSKNWEKALFPLGILFVVLAPLVFFFWEVENPGERAIFLLVTGLLLAILSRFGDVQELAVYGLKAKLERVLSDAYATLDQVKEFAKISAISSLSNTGRSDWLGGITDQQKIKILSSTQETLKRLGCDEEEIKNICKDFHDCQLTDYRQALLGSNFDFGTEQGLYAHWLDLRRRPVIPPVLPDELTAFFEEHNLMTPKLRERLEGYKYYYENHEFQDFADFEKRQKWPRLKATKSLDNQCPQDRQ